MIREMARKKPMTTSPTRLRRMGRKETLTAQAVERQLLQLPMRKGLTTTQARKTVEKLRKRHHLKMQHPMEKGNKETLERKYLMPMTAVN